MEAISKDAAITKIDSALETVDEIPPYESGRYDDIEFEQNRDRRKRRAVMRMKSTVDSLTRPGSAFRVESDRTMNASVDDFTRVDELAGLLVALREEIDAGYLANVATLVEANVFADFLEMASELLDKGYKDPAAVLVGSVIEEHLRSLAVSAQVSVESDGKPVKADKLNADLVKAGEYEKGDQKQITAWLNLRNDAAHGHFDKYDEQRVGLMIEGVRGFVRRSAPH